MKCASDALRDTESEEYFSASAERRVAAREVRVVSWDADGVGRSVLGGRGSTEENQEADGSQTKPPIIATSLRGDRCYSRERARRGLEDEGEAARAGRMSAVGVFPKILDRRLRAHVASPTGKGNHSPPKYLKAVY